MGLPAGTVTLLFADIEGSTRLVRELGEEWAAVLDRCRELCSAGWRVGRGHEVEVTGDSFFVAFTRADDAVAAARHVHHLLAAEPWSMPVRVRIGIHTGRPQHHGDGYIGLDVHRAARIASAAHGGQTVISESVVLAVSGADGADVIDVRPLGRHRLKGVPEPIRLFQVSSITEEETFPQLRSQGGVADLPAPVTTTVGRDAERADIAGLLASGTTRLVTLTGIGGIGKTRLGLAAAHDLVDEFDDGVYFTPLASVTTSSAMWGAIAERMGLPDSAHLPPGFFEHLGARHTLLVLDSLEEVQGAAEVVAALLRGAPGVAVIATSRRPLRIEGELEYPVPPLSLPGTDTVDALRESGAGRLFLDHARRARRGFEIDGRNAADVAAVLRSLDGIPLAVEIAAARVRVLSPGALLARMGDALDFRSDEGDRDHRHRTVRTVIGWSYDLLDDDARRVLDHLSVFSGSASVNALRAVAALTPEVDVLSLADTLVADGLVRVLEDDDGEPRFGLLETVKRYAADQLRAKGLEADAVARHAAFFLSLYEGMGRGQEQSPRYTRITDRELADIALVVERLPDGTPAASDAVALLLRACAGAMHHQMVANSAPVALLRLGASTDRTLGDARLLMILAQSLSRLGRVEDAFSTYELAAGFLGPEHDRDLTDPGVVEVAIDVLDGLVYCMGRLGRAHEAAPFVREADRVAATATTALPYSYHNLRYLDAYHRTRDYPAARFHYQRVIEKRRTDEGFSDTARDVNNLADLLFKEGGREAAQRFLAAQVGAVVADPAIPNQIITVETFAEVVSESHPLACALALGSVDAVRATEGVARTPLDAELDKELIDATLPTVGEVAWKQAFDRGRGMDLATVLHELAALPLHPDVGAPRG